MHGALAKRPSWIVPAQAGRKAKREAHPNDGPGLRRDDGNRSITYE